MLIKNANVYLPDRKFIKCDVLFSDIITEIGQICSKADINAEGCYLLPGLIDIHTHGAVGCDASDGSPEGLRKMALYYALNGVTSFCATTMTLGEDVLTRVMHMVRSYVRPANGARCSGVNLEGPFLSYTKRGAQAAEYLHDPDTEMFKRLNEASGGNIRIVCLAPEQSDAMKFIRAVSKICTVSLAHTTASYDIAVEAYKNGATQATHLFNCMNQYHHREPAVVGATMDEGGYAELICDGLHIHPSVVRGIFRMFPGKTILISDSLRCAGMPDGNYELGGQPIIVKESRATLLDGTLAGSCISLLKALQNAVAFGIPFENAVESATIMPARTIRMDDHFGSIELDKAADMIILNKNLELLTTIIEGKVVQK